MIGITKLIIFLNSIILKINMSDKKIAVLGLGYVGLPLAVQLSLSYQVKGFDLDNNRVSQLRKGIDKTLEVNEFSTKKTIK